MLNAKAFRQTRRSEAFAVMMSVRTTHYPNRIARVALFNSNMLAAIQSEWGFKLLPEAGVHTWGLGIKPIPSGRLETGQVSICSPIPTYPVVPSQPKQTVGHTPPDRADRRSPTTNDG